MLGDAHGVFSAQGKTVGLNKEGVTAMHSDVLIVNCAKSCHQGNNEKLGMVVLTCNPSTQEAIGIKFQVILACTADWESLRQLVSLSV